MKKAILTVLATVTVLSSSLTAFAAPEVMPDGVVFDAEYYAQNNPDVAAVLGTDTDALYQHYANFGKEEGRLACAPTATEERTGMSLDEWLNLEGNAAELDAVTAAVSNDEMAVSVYADGDVLVMRYTFRYVLEFDSYQLELVQQLCNQLFDDWSSLTQSVRDALIEETGNPNIRLRVEYINGDGFALFIREF